MNSNTSIPKEHHLLLLNYHEIKVFHLESRLLVLGRDPSKDIAVPCEKVSREHATLLRVPSYEPNKFEYRLIDGGPSQNRSKNGILINGKNAYMHLLDHGDMISFGGAVKGIYLKVEFNDKDLNSYLSMISTAKEINERIRNKILLMTRVFDKLMPYLSKNNKAVKLIKC